MGLLFSEGVRRKLSRDIDTVKDLDVVHWQIADTWHQFHILSKCHVVFFLQAIKQAPK